MIAKSKEETEFDRRRYPMTIMPELKPCPFCGGKAILFVSDGVRVLCTNCYATTKILRDRIDGVKVSGNAAESVIEAWNNRANQTAVRRSLQKPMSLEAVLEKSKHIDDSVVWLEQPDEDGDNCVVPALVSNCSRYDAHGIQNVKFLVWPKNEEIFPVVGQTGYGHSWRCWENHPTDEERDAAAWEG